MASEVSPFIAMTPDETVQWRSQDVPELYGSMLLSQDAGEDVTDLLTQFAHITRYWTLHPDRTDLLDCEFVDGGSQGCVYRIGDYAIKEFHSLKGPRFNIPTTQRETNFDNLRANIVLETGVRLMNAANVGVEYFNNGVSYTTPRHLGAFIPHAESDPAIRPYWVMSFEPSNAPHYELPPTIRERHDHNKDALGPFLLKALQACGSDRTSVNIGEVIYSAKPVIRYEEPRRRSVGQWLLRVDPYKDVECTVVLHDARA